MKLIQYIVFALPLIATTVVIAQSQEPSVAQPGSAIKWLRCPVGQTWNKETNNCQGEATRMNWNAAMSSCPQGYRLPSENEYVDLLDCKKEKETQAPPGLDAYYWRCNSCNTNSKCQSMFGNDKGSYWSSTQIPFNRGHAWNFHFSSGAGMNYGPKAPGEGAAPFSQSVRCVSKTSTTQHATNKEKKVDCSQCAEEKRIDCVRKHGNGTVAPDGRIRNKCLDMAREGIFWRQCGCFN